jgi:hypothetical protein
MIKQEKQLRGGRVRETMGRLTIRAQLVPWSWLINICWWRLSSDAYAGVALAAHGTPNINRHCLQALVKAGRGAALISDVCATSRTCASMAKPKTHAADDYTTTHQL